LYWNIARPIILTGHRSSKGQKGGFRLNKRTKKILGALLLGAGAVGTARALLMKRPGMRKRHSNGEPPVDVWARPGMLVVFRAELKPGRDASERTFRVAELLPNGRVLLVGIAGEHTESEFERVRLN
jgi:hypothetical protein